LIQNFSPLKLLKFLIKLFPIFHSISEDQTIQTDFISKKLFIIFIYKNYLTISTISSLENLTFGYLEYLSSQLLYQIGSTTTEAKPFSFNHKTSSYFTESNHHIAQESIHFSAKTFITFHSAINTCSLAHHVNTSSLDLETNHLITSSYHFKFSLEAPVMDDILSKDLST
jgi:hypothetical protein